MANKHRKTKNFTSSLQFQVKKYINLVYYSSTEQSKGWDNK